MAAKPWTKHWTEVERYAFDYSARLGEGETIISGTLTSEPAGLEISDEEISGSTISHLVAEGDVPDGETSRDYTLTCSVTTSEDRVLREEYKLTVTA
jgi:hypothetical protein